MMAPQFALASSRETLQPLSLCWRTSNDAGTMQRVARAFSVREENSNLPRPRAVRIGFWRFLMGGGWERRSDLHILYSGSGYYVVIKWIRTSWIDFLHTLHTG